MNRLLTFLQTQYIRKLDCNLQFLLSSYSVEDIVAHITSWLETNKATYFDTTTFARDFYIGSDMTEEEKEHFYNELKKQGFFRKLNEFLYSDNFSISSWTIYTIGKFSNPENAAFLETAYEINYVLNNPILAYRCLGELSWLSSEKVDQYLKDLEADESLPSKLILLYYWAPNNSSPGFKALLQDKELINAIVPDLVVTNNEEIISERLFHFENHIAGLFKSTGNISMEKKDFENAAKEYFKNFR